MKRTFTTYTGKYTLEYIPSSEIWIYKISNKHYLEIRKSKTQRNRKILSDCWIHYKCRCIEKKEIASAMKIEYLLPSIQSVLFAIDHDYYVF